MRLATPRFRDTRSPLPLVLTTPFLALVGLLVVMAGVYVSLRVIP